METNKGKTIADFNLADIITRLSRREKLTAEESRYFGGVQSKYRNTPINDVRGIAVAAGGNLVAAGILALLPQM